MYIGFVLFHRHRFGEVARLVHVGAFEQGDVVLVAFKLMTLLFQFALPCEVKPTAGTSFGAGAGYTFT